MSKTVADRATELGLDKQQLVQALKLIGHNKLMFDGWNRNTGPWYSRWRKYKQLLSLEQAASALGVDPEDAKREIKIASYHSWTMAEVITAMFDFHKEHGRWPKSKEYTQANGLPPLNQWRNLRSDFRVSARDFWERQIAADRRCGPLMAIGLRNVLARKEAIDRIGFEKFVKDGLATVITEDAEYGTLYRLPGETPKEPMVLLKVINSTPEPDGSFADYYLRVPPTMTDVREALRWTFGGDETLGSQLYEPLVQT